MSRGDQERALRYLALMIVASWWTFPLVFALGALGYEQVAEAAFVCLELSAKVLCTLVMMHGRIETVQERERRSREWLRQHDIFGFEVPVDDLLLVEVCDG